MLSENGLPHSDWDSYDSGSGGFNSVCFQQKPAGQAREKSHQRALSGSSIASTGPASPYDQATSHPQIANPEASPLSSSGFDSSYDADQAQPISYVKPLPTPSHTPSQDSFLAPAFQNYNPSTQDSESNMAAQMAMKRALLDHHGSPAADTPGFSYSAARSDTTAGHDSPATPKTSYDEGEDGFKVPPNGEERSMDAEQWMGEYLQFDDLSDRHHGPKFARTISDIYQDELFNPASVMPVPASSKAGNTTSLLSPYRGIVSERIQAANSRHINARSQSPTATVSRDTSPFRPESPYAPSVAGLGVQRSPRTALGSATHMRQQQKAEADALAFKQHQRSSVDPDTPKTISPKDALLDYHETEEDANMPLFLPNDRFSVNGSQENSFNDSDHDRAHVDDGFTEHGFGSLSTSRRPSSSSYSSRSAPAQNGSGFTFVPPSVPGSVQMPQQYPFLSQQRRQESSTRSRGSHGHSHFEQNPEFPAHLTSMESSASDAGLEIPSENKKPPGAMAEGGTYTCTYHGCTLRFESPAKLQRHKREGHRQSTPQISNSGMTSAALMRNSQAGPHKCERINPSTGKPCNTIFSRPYDLTRHEDTIHNARKQKVRCHLCTEEKTFSRNDALTRHMRVVHPEVDFPGKSRRKHQD
ncbi:MAG: hypothetical protein M1819_005374 [Sarea resinae]|nr:MAG: hypothetical protein M1819_005374 [Sarea resinae]